MGSAFLTISFQSHTWEWGGLVNFLNQGAFLLVLLVFVVQTSRARGVHPVGHRRRIILVGISPVLAAVVGGWFWMAPSHRDVSWVVTTAVAVLASVPWAILGLQLMIKGTRRTSLRHEPH